MRVCLRCEHLFSSAGWACPACGYEPQRLNGIEAHAAELADYGGGFKPEYYVDLAGLEAQNFWFEARNELILWALGTYKPNAQSLLEVGCGTGFVLAGIAKAYPAIALSGSEIFVAGLAHAARRVPSAHLMQMDARRIPFQDEFDVIGAFDVLEHIEEDWAVLRQIYRALKPGGILLLTVPQHPKLWSIADEHACHVRRYTEVEIETKVRECRLSILRSTSFVTMLLPAMMLSRIANKAKKGEFDPAGELKIGRVVNKMFFYVMMFELATIRLGLDYPAGGSRLIIASK